MEALKGLNPKQCNIYLERKFLSNSNYLVFIHFSGDGQRISAIEFFKLCKLCKIYPVVITFEDLKKIVLKNKEFWQHHHVEDSEPTADNSFPFHEFVNAFRIVGRIGYAKTGESDVKLFQLVTQYL